MAVNRGNLSQHHVMEFPFRNTFTFDRSGCLSEIILICGGKNENEKKHMKKEQITEISTINTVSR